MLIKIMKFPEIPELKKRLDENQRDQYKALSALRGRPSTT
jgi:hypothetical protein